jgi:hypothetical protein
MGPSAPMVSELRSLGAGAPAPVVEWDLGSVVIDIPAQRGQWVALTLGRAWPP